MENMLKQSGNEHFANALANRSNNIRVTENGAKGYATTESYLVDLNFQTSSLRMEEPEQITILFERAFQQDPEMALKWAFFLRDVRGGMGEKRSSRIIFKYLAEKYPKVLADYIELIPVYGRWDDIMVFKDTPLVDVAMVTIRNQLLADLAALDNGDTSKISLLSKWLPNVNSRNVETRILAAWVMYACGYSRSKVGAKQYRTDRAKLNAAIDVVEVKMSDKRFNEIVYPAVPSRAAMIYREAFKRQDGDRYEEFINRVLDGDEKMNASCVFPHEIIHKYREGGESDGWYTPRIPSPLEINKVLEALWKSFPDTHADMCKESSTLVVTDVSASMNTELPNSRVTAYDVSIGLSIYFAERLTGPFKDKSILFSSRPEFLDISGNTLADKLVSISKFDDCSNTNIEATFDLILNTAIENKLSQEDLPENLLIISDMEFDYCCRGNDRLFDMMADKFKCAGYKLPRLVFWNVFSRSGAIPMTTNENGVTLVSGFSPNVMRMVFSGILDPYMALRDVLYTERYEKIIVTKYMLSQ